MSTPRCARCAARCSRPTSRSTWSASFIERVREQAIGATVVKSVTPGQMVVKIVHDELIATLGSDGQTIDLNAVPPVAIMMVGLQGSGKTTTTAKLARRLVQRDKRKVLMASLDIYRPAAMEQLAVLGRDLDIPTLADRGRPDSRRRSRSARSKPASSAATTSCCSTPPAAPRSTKR